MSTDANAGTHEEAGDSVETVDYDAMLDTLDVAIEEAQYKIENGRVRSPENEKVRSTRLHRERPATGGERPRPPRARRGSGATARTTRGTGTVSRKSRREIERAIEQLDTEGDDMDITQIESEVTTVTPENIGEREPTVSDDATILATESDVVTWWVEPVEDGG